MEMEKNCKSYYAVIPASVRYDDDLTPNAKLLYGEITALTNETGYCWASNEYFAQLYKVSNRSISDWIGQLKIKGYIEINMKYKENSKVVETREIKIPDTKITMKKGKGEKAPKELKNLYMEFVELTQEQYDKLVADYTEAKAKEMISRVNNYIGSTGKKYKSHYHTILNWLNKDGIKPVTKAETPSSSGLKIDENGNLIRG